MVWIAPKLRDGLAGCLQGTFGRNWSVRYSRFLLWRRLCFLLVRKTPLEILRQPADFRNHPSLPGKDTAELPECPVVSTH